MLTAEMGTAGHSKMAPSKIVETYETSTFHKESMESRFQETQEIFNGVHGFSSKALRHSHRLGRAEKLGIQSSTALLEHIALPDAFLRDYYTQVQY